MKTIILLFISINVFSQTIAINKENPLPELYNLRKELMNEDYSKQRLAWINFEIWAFENGKVLCESKDSTSCCHSPKVPITYENFIKYKHEHDLVLR